MKKHRVVQWATGVVGTSALRGIIRNPRLDLVGVKVYADDKKGKDAGRIPTRCADCSRRASI